MHQILDITWTVHVWILLALSCAGVAQVMNRNSLAGLIIGGGLGALAGGNVTLTWLPATLSIGIMAMLLGRRLLVWLALGGLCGPWALALLVLFKGRHDPTRDENSVLFEILWLLTKLKGHNTRTRTN